MKISRIGFGGMSLEPDDPFAETLLLRALDGGINYFDTADIYHQGRNETCIGRAFSGKRNQIILATKVGNQWRTDGSGLDWVPTKKYILSAIDKSLERFQTDYIDLYQLHGGTLEDPIDDIIEAFEQLRLMGKIRYYGISSIRPNVIREYVKRSSIISVMMQYSLLDRRPEEEMLSFLQDNQIGVLARGSIAKGLLINKAAESYLNYSAIDVSKLAHAINEISTSDRSAAAAAIHFVLNHSAISSAIIGIHTEQQLKEALDINLSEGLSEKQYHLLSQIIPVNYYDHYR